MGFRLRRSARLGPLRFHFSANGLSSISVGSRGASLNLPVNRRGGVRTSIGIPGTGLSWSVEQPVQQAPQRLGGSRRLGNLPLTPAPAPSAPEQHSPAVLASAEEALAWVGADDDAPAWAGRDADAPQRAAAGNEAAGRAAAAPEAEADRHDSPPSIVLPNSRRLRPRQLKELRQHCRQLFEQQLFRSGSEPRRLWEEALVSRLLCDPAISGRLAGLLALIETPQSLTAFLERARSQGDLKRRCQRCLLATETALRLCGQRGWLI